MMSRMFTALGALVVAIAALTGGVEAKTVFYEINGQRYSYSTNNIQQVKEARQRIEAGLLAQVQPRQPHMRPVRELLGP